MRASARRALGCDVYVALSALVRLLSASVACSLIDERLGERVTNANLALGNVGQMVSDYVRVHAARYDDAQTHDRKRTWISST